MSEVVGMSLLDKIRSRKADETAAASAAYYSALRSLDPADDAAADDILALLDAAGKSVDDLAADVATLQKMRELANQAAQIDKRRKASERADQALLKACAERQEATLLQNQRVATANGDKVEARSNYERSINAKQQLKELSEKYPNLGPLIK